jgi:predicted nucleic acid-binding protein
VSNAGPLISLATIGQFDLLSNLFEEVFIPRAVHTEVVVHGTGKPGASETAGVAWIRVVDVQNRLAVDLLRNELDSGESEAIVLAEELNADYILMDEAAARRKIGRSGLKKVGTLGILLMAKESGLIKAVKPLLDKLTNSSFRMSKKVYREILLKAKEVR